jgi:hypothetical protein
MNTREITQPLRDADPRRDARFVAAIEADVEALSERLDEALRESVVASPQRLRDVPRRRALGVGGAGVALAVAAAVVAFLTIGSSGNGPGVENAAAAIAKAATLTAASAEQSGTVVVHMTHGGEPWAGKTVRWNGDDIEIRRDAAEAPGKPWIEFLVVDGMMYGIDPVDGTWIELGSPNSVDPGSGTTPSEILATVREDVGGTTLRRITGGMLGLTARGLPDGSTVYAGKVAAGLIARETGFKEGETIRVLPFGYVAHDDAADPAAELDTAVTVGADGIVRELAVTWGSGDSTWTYVVGYGALGATAAPEAPANARPLRDRIPA